MTGVHVKPNKRRNSCRPSTVSPRKSKKPSNRFSQTSCWTHIPKTGRKMLRTSTRQNQSTQRWLTTSKKSSTSGLKRLSKLLKRLNQRKRMTKKLVPAKNLNTGNNACENLPASLNNSDPRTAVPSLMSWPQLLRTPPTMLTDLVTKSTLPLASGEALSSVSLKLSTKPKTTLSISRPLKSSSSHFTKALLKPSRTPFPPLWTLSRWFTLSQDTTTLTREWPDFSSRLPTKWLPTASTTLSTSDVSD